MNRIPHANALTNALTRQQQHLRNAAAGARPLAAAVAVSLVPVLAALHSAGAGAAEPEAGWYGGINLGQSYSKDIDGHIDSAFANQGARTSTNSEDNEFAYSLLGGYKFMRNFAVEGGYVDFGKFGYHSLVSAPATDRIDGQYEAHGWTLAGVGLLPLNERLSLYGKAGLIFSRVDLDASPQSGAVDVNDRSHDGTNPMFGLGASYDLGNNLAATTEWNRYVNLGDTNGTGRADINLFTVGLRYQFH